MNPVNPPDVLCAAAPVTCFVLRRKREKLDGEKVEEIGNMERRNTEKEKLWKKMDWMRVGVKVG